VKTRTLVLTAAGVLTALAATLGLGAAAGTAQAASTYGRSWAASAVTSDNGAARLGT
jgi:hypothetical protein